MKKYIKTNEGVFEVLDKETDVCVLTNHTWKYKKDIIADDDDLYALIDEVVNDNLSNEYVKLCDIRILFQTKAQAIKSLLHRLHISGVKNIYGAIWVKGENGEPILKSVSKMNENGDLVLL